MSQDVGAAVVGLARAGAGAAHAASHVPTRAIVVGIGLCIILAMFQVALAVVSSRQPRGGDDDDDHASGPGGGGPRRRGPDGGDAPGGAPTWWADFEREFAACVSERQASVR